MKKAGEKPIKTSDWKSTAIVIIAIIFLVCAVVAAFFAGAKFFSKISINNEMTNGDDKTETNAEDLYGVKDLLELLQKQNKVNSENQTITSYTSLEIQTTSTNVPGITTTANPNAVPLCQADATTRGMTMIYVNSSLTNSTCNLKSMIQCTSIGKLPGDYFWNEPLKCCEWRCINPPAPGCSDTDGNNNYLKGTCTDASGSSTDNCPLGNFKNMVSESWCSGSTCMGASLSCPVGSLCYDGRCYTQVEDADGDGYSDLSEYGNGTNPNDASSHPSSGFICTDSDGVDYTNPGTCRDAEGQYNDYCNQGTMMEYSCDLGTNRCKITQNWCGTNDNYCSVNRCIPGSMNDCSGVCTILGNKAAGGFCGNKAETIAWSPCTGLGGENGFFLITSPLLPSCSSNPEPFVYCCCYADAVD